ncbi:MAG: hypothetical protein PHU85_16195, partial [Phycisphaerae bacterium]|nr:hypothetical protein [Phycisphaerae bacterium]
MISAKDKEIIHRLAAAQAEIAALPVQEQKRSLWRKLNALRPARPMVTIDQVCWNEMNVDDELTLRCEDRECRGYEQELRRRLYQWRHFPVDMVVEPFIRVPKAVRNSGFGMAVQENVAITDPTNSVRGHGYTNQFQTDADLDKVKTPVIEHNAAETARRIEVANELFAGTLPVLEYGIEPYLSVWDPLSTWMSVEGALYGLIDRPDFMRELVGRIVAGYMSMLDQLEA